MYFIIYSESVFGPSEYLITIHIQLTPIKINLINDHIMPDNERTKYIILTFKIN